MRMGPPGGETKTAAVAAVLPAVPRTDGARDDAALGCYARPDWPFVLRRNTPKPTKALPSSANVAGSGT